MIKWDGKQLRSLQKGGLNVCPGCGQEITGNLSGFCWKCETAMGIKHETKARRKGLT